MKNQSSLNVSRPKTERCHKLNSHSNTRELFHFTRLEYVSSILTNGIDSGYTQINLWESVPGVCLIEIGDLYQQFWKCGLPKNGFRISVRLKGDDPLLWCREAVAKQLNISRRDFKTLIKRGDGHPQKWSIYLGTIPVSAIQRIWFSPLRRFLTPSEIPAFKSKPQIRGVYPVFPYHRCLTKEEALKRAALVENGRAA